MNGREEEMVLQSQVDLCEFVSRIALLACIAITINFGLKTFTPPPATHVRLKRIKIAQVRVHLP